MNINYYHTGETLFQVERYGMGQPVLDPDSRFWNREAMLSGSGTGRGSRSVYNIFIE